MDYTTQELIERYKSEMQKMISNSLDEKSAQTEQNTQGTPQIITDSDEQNAGKFPYLSSQEPSPPRVDEFPEFETDSEGLTRRIEEILRQNSDVITSDDYPKPRYEDGRDENTQTQEATNPVERPQMEENPPIDPDENPQETVSRVCIRGGAKAQYSPPANTGLALNNDPTQTNALSDNGTLRVEAFAANRAFPIPNAVIRVRNKESGELVAVVTTNEDGTTDSIILPAPNKTLSQTSETRNPYENYLVDIAASGYAAQNDLDVQMFGGIEAILPVNLFPQNNV